MKVGIVGAGFVGAASANALALRGVASELVLVDVDERKASAEASDVAHVAAFSAPIRVSAGGPEALAGSSVVVITAGASQRPGETRLDLAGRNADVVKAVTDDVVRHAPEAVIVVATNPVDVMTRIAERRAAAAGVPSARVFGTGTMLDTARFREIVATRIGIDVTHVHGYVVGEHGDSEVLVWSSVDVGGRPLDAFAGSLDVAWGEAERAAVEDEVVNAAYRIIEGKGATYYGVAAVVAHAVETIARDRRSILTVSAWSETFGCALSLPRLVSGEGIVREVGVSLDGDEHARLQRSAEVLRGSAERLGV
jgi:L-lactate dehydrogenase